MNPRKHLLTNMLTGLALLQTAYFTNAAQAATPAMQQQQPGTAMTAHDPAMMGKDKSMMEKQPSTTQY